MKGFVLLLFVFVSSASFDCTSCVFVEGQLFPFDLAHQCQLCFPFNKTIADHTVTNLLKALELYAFLDVAVDPPAPFEQVNMRKELSTIKGMKFDSDFEFQESIRGVFLRLRDAHTNYYSPVPQQFIFWQPINFFSYTDEQDGTLKLEVTNVTADLIAQHFADKMNLSDFYGAQVLEIDDQDAVQHVIDFATNEIGTSKEIQTRFNIATFQR